MSFDFFGFGCFGPDEDIPEESLLNELEEQIEEDRPTEDDESFNEHGDNENEL